MSVRSQSLQGLNCQTVPTVNREHPTERCKVLWPPLAMHLFGDPPAAPPAGGALALHWPDDDGVPLGPLRHRQRHTTNHPPRTPAHACLNPD